MLFAVRMDVDIPTDLDPDDRADLLAREKAYSHELQRAGKWMHIWRIVGQYSNLASSTSPTTRNCTPSCGDCRCSAT